ncbi:MAG TPA: DUF4142 domain-containing protein [Longimicrobium sp.]|uniref:DUF4142 domain-containing protein n=1 Tax=Longimicrobium sp. TaxID=2029185 RepID=UPI002ED9A63E
MIRAGAVRVSAFALALAAAAACAKEPNPDIENPPSEAGRALPLTADTGGGAQTGAAAGQMTDANIAAVASASNQDEIQTSQIALQKATRPDVRQFAQQMVDEHTRVEQQMRQALQAKGMAPQDNAMSQQMKQTMQAALQQLGTATGAAFDEAYVAHQVQSHQATLQALQTQLIPNARDPQLKQMLQAVQPRVQQHLQMAQSLQGAGSTAPAGSGAAAPAGATAPAGAAAPAGAGAAPAAPAGGH